MERRDAIWVVVLLPLFALVLYAGAYGIARATVLDTFWVCDSVWPCPTTFFGPPAAITTFAPAMELETRARLVIDGWRGP